jgi:hypothetical protein
MTSKCEHCSRSYEHKVGLPWPFCSHVCQITRQKELLLEWQIGKSELWGRWNSFACDPELIEQSASRFAAWGLDGEIVLTYLGVAPDPTDSAFKDLYEPWKQDRVYDPKFRPSNAPADEDDHQPLDENPELRPVGCSVIGDDTAGDRFIPSVSHDDLVAHLTAQQAAGFRWVNVVKSTRFRAMQIEEFETIRHTGKFPKGAINQIAHELAGSTKDSGKINRERHPAQECLRYVANSIAGDWGQLDALKGRFR